MKSYSSEMLLVLSKESRGIGCGVFFSSLTTEQPTVCVGEFAIQIPVSCSKRASSSKRLS